MGPNLCNVMQFDKLQRKN